MSNDTKASPPLKVYDEEENAIPREIARQLAAYQGQMVEYLKILASDERMEQAKTIVIQQALLTHSVDRLHEDLQQAGEKLEAAVGKLNAAFMGLMKVPVACVIVGAASWAFMYSGKISETTWLIIMGVAVFPWLGESITAIGKLVRGRNGDGK